MDAVLALSQGKVAILDDDAFTRELSCVFKDGVQWRGSLGSLGWYANKNRNTFYAMAHWRSPDGRNRKIKLHRAITGAASSVLVDHRDGDGLNNRIANLRIANGTLNNANCHTARKNKSGFKGVRLDKNRYEAGVRDRGRMVRIGRFDTAEEAAKAYDAKALELFGEFAQLNFPIHSKAS